MDTGVHTTGYYYTDKKKKEKEIKYLLISPKKEPIMSWNDMMFWVNYPFKVKTSYTSTDIFLANINNWCLWNRVHCHFERFHDRSGSLFSQAMLWCPTLIKPRPGKGGRQGAWLFDLCMPPEVLTHLNGTIVQLPTFSLLRKCAQIIGLRQLGFLPDIDVRNNASHYYFVLKSIPQWT